MPLPIEDGTSETRAIALERARLRLRAERQQTEALARTTRARELRAKAGQSRGWVRKIFLWLARRHDDRAVEIRASLRRMRNLKRVAADIDTGIHRANRRHMNQESSHHD